MEGFWVAKEDIANAIESEVSTCLWSAYNEAVSTMPIDAILDENLKKSLVI